LFKVKHSPPRLHAKETKQTTVALHGAKKIIIEQRGDDCTLISSQLPRVSEVPAIFVMECRGEYKDEVHRCGADVKPVYSSDYN
jgi:hypothetical protein